MIEFAVHLLLFMFINLVMVLAGYQLIKKEMVFFSWILLLVSIIIVIIICRYEAPVARMLLIIITTFTGMKVVAATKTYQGKTVGLTFKQWAIFATGWMGMRTQAFETFGDKALPDATPMIWFGASRVAAGSLLILSGHMFAQAYLFGKLTYYIVSLILLVGFSLILHFGLLGISAGIWRLQGANTYTLFRQPLKSTSLTELWSKRWNVAFSEMTSITIYRPLRNRTGAGTALMASFIFSGLLHELALSVPVNSGYGLPTAYFTLQGLMVLAERTIKDHTTGFLQNEIAARVWTFFWIIMPMPLLFHTQFMQQVVWPLAGLGKVAV